MRTSVNKGRSCSPVQPQIPLRVQIIVDSSVVGYDGAVRDEEHSVWQMKPEREQKEETKQSRWGFRGKTVWDFLQLLIVPLMLVAIGLVFSLQQDGSPATGRERTRRGRAGACGAACAG